MSTSGAAPAGGPPSGAAGGDLAGVYPAPSVARLQGHGVSANAPGDTQALVWNAGLGLWVPTSLAIPAASAAVTGPDAFGAAASAGVANTFSRGDHDHGLPANPAPAASAAVTGPDAFGAAASVGVANTFSRGDHDHGLPANPSAPFAAPAIALGTAAAAGASGGKIRADATIVAFDVTAPVAQAFGDAAAVGAAAVASRRDHRHGMPAQPAFLHGAAILRVHLATATNLADNSSVVIPFDTVDEDTAGVWSGANHNYPVPAAGLYLVVVTASWGVSGATNPTLAVTITKGGADAHEGPQIVPSSTRANAIDATALVRCAANDTLGGKAFQISGAAMAYNTGATLTYMHIIRLAD